MSVAKYIISSKRRKMIKVIVIAIAGFSLVFSAFSVEAEPQNEYKPVITVSGSGGLVPPKQP